METIYMSMKFSDYPDSERPVTLMSIGLVSADGNKTFYGQIYSLGVETDVSPFFMDNVLPLFDANPLTQPIDYQEVHAAMTKNECRAYLTLWLNDFGHRIKIVSNALEEEIDFAFHFFTGNIRQDKQFTHFDECTLTEEKRASFIQIFHRSYKQGYRRHHALDDAKVMRLALLG